MKEFEELYFCCKTLENHLLKRHSGSFLYFILYFIHRKQTPMLAHRITIGHTSDFAKDSLREKLANCYAEVLHHFDFDAGIPENELGDVIFCAIMEKIVPPSGSLNERSRRDVALVIMAKYFETCDIFEEPPHVAS